MIELSVVIPVYKAETSLKELAARTTAALAEITENYELLLVEDHGGDSSWELIEEVARENPRIKGIKFCRNFGQHYAISAGLDLAEGNWVAIMDCDLQDRPEEIAKLYEKALEGYDVVLARRVARAAHAVPRGCCHPSSCLVRWKSGF